jgi:uncharacterized protein YjbI with pentapeptide repeats
MRRISFVLGALFIALLCALALTAVSSPAGATPLKKPGPPTSFNAVPVNTAIALSWGPPTSDGGSTITSYVATAIPGDETRSTSGSGTSCEVTGLKNGHHYKVNVRAINGVGEGKRATIKHLVPNTTQNCSYVGPYANLQSCNLSAHPYAGFNLTDADLDTTDFYGDSLNSADLTGVNATNADLYHVDLSGADLSDANLTDANMNGATLSSYNNDNVLVAADISDAILTNSMATGAGNNLDVVEWGGITGTPTTLPSGWVFTERYLLGPGIAPSGPYGADLTGGELANVDLTDANLTTATLTDADLTNANMTSTDLYGTSGWDSATLTGIIWNDTTCPDGTNSNTYDPQTCLNDGA